MSEQPIKCTVNGNPERFHLIITITLPYIIWPLSNINPLR